MVLPVHILSVGTLTLPTYIFADSRYISPGIKFGYTFGKGGGVTVGAEVSYIVWYKNAANAVVLNFDICGNEDKLQFSKLHLGYQVSSIVGAEAGPTIIWTDQETLYGLTLTPFAGFVMPYVYCSYTMILNKERDFGEAGFLLKFPISLPGHPPPSIGLN
jgi:hypothetical protein